tara:strand:+ start:5 stop:940 length:936 start_codon:yes stop_codon:yes gene_type:complete
MSLEDLGLIDYEIVDRTLNIDGDIVIYRPCCIHNEDDDQSRRLITKDISSMIDKLMLAAGCNTYIMFVTTKFNFRDQLVDDYKAKRLEVVRPINLTYAKRWAVENLNTHFHKGLEADDLLGIHMTDDTVLWSLDKDLRQVPGKHLDDATMKVIDITKSGSLKKEVIYKDCGIRIKKTKHHFTGLIGLYFQMLTGDTTDWIVGCGVRETGTFKSGPNKGKERIVRKGVGPGQAFDLLYGSKLTGDALKVVINEYKKIHSNAWQQELETQANLLFMVREQKGEIIKRWTYDGRPEYFDLIKGVIVDGEHTCST